MIETLLFSTFVAWKTFFPLVRDDSSCTYTFITGQAFALSYFILPYLILSDLTSVYLNLSSCLVWCVCLSRRSGWEGADARHWVPNRGCCQCIGFLPGAEGRVSWGAVQTQPGETFMGSHSGPWRQRYTSRLQMNWWFTHTSPADELMNDSHLSDLQVKIDTGVATPERMAPGFLNHMDLGEAVATLVERRNTSHHVFTINSPADLKAVLLEGNL